MVASLSAQDQLASLMASTMPQEILAFKFSDGIQKRIQFLVEKKKDEVLLIVEQEELDKYLMYDLLIGLAKARAFKQT